MKGGGFLKTINGDYMGDLLESLPESQLIPPGVPGWYTRSDIAGSLGYGMGRVLAIIRERLQSGEWEAGYRMDGSAKWKVYALKGTPRR